MSNSNVNVEKEEAIAAISIVAGGLIGGIAGNYIEKNKPKEEQKMLEGTIKGVVLGCLCGAVGYILANSIVIVTI